jgi:DNA-binding HxlR family transcriptional regulator
LRWYSVVPGTWQARPPAPTPQPDPKKEGTAIPPPPPPKRHPYDQWSPDARALDLVGDKWTLLIVRDLAGGPRRFVELQRTLPGISTEQLRSRLNRMVADELLTRTRYREVPPRVDYELTERSRELLAVVAELARWGRRWAWGAPHAGEDVDVGAVLRSVAGARVTPDLSGTVAFTVEAPDGSGRTMTLEAAGGALSYGEQVPPDVGTQVRGSQAAFVAALGPEGARGGLRISGDARLAGALLDVLCGAPGAPASQAA